MSNKVSRLLVLVFCVVCAGAGMASRMPAAAANGGADQDNGPDGPLYVIQANDLLEINVWKEPDLTRKVLVRPDGRVSLPLVQDMQAAGRTPAKLKDEIEKELKKSGYYQEDRVPTVTVIVEAIQSYRVFVTGKVAKAGVIQTEKPITVLQALSLAGGFLEYANVEDMAVIRTNGVNNELFRFNYPDVIKGKNFNQNMLLRAGDVVVVP